MQNVTINSPIPILTNISGTITAGGTAQTIAAENVYRRGFWIQNLGSSPIYFRFGTDAVASQPSFRLDAGMLYESPATGCPLASISIICATTGQEFSAGEF